MDEDSITARKKAEAERLRAAEKFMVVGGGNGTCKSCGYEYKQEKGDPDFPVAKGISFTVRGTRSTRASSRAAQARTHTLTHAHAHALPARPPAQDLPNDYTCPVCSSPKAQFSSSAKVLAGFAENQKYGLGFNSATGGEKLLVIYGALGTLFLLLIGGYALE